MTASKAAPVSNEALKTTPDADSADRRATAAEQALRQREAIDDSEQKLRNDAFVYFQIVCGLFGILITAIVVFFALRQNHEAKAEARDVARAEMGTFRDELNALHAGVEQARAERDRQAAEITDTLARVKTMEGEAAASARKTESHAASSEQAAVRANEALKDVSRQKAEGQAPPLTDDQRRALDAAAEENKQTAQSKWTVNQFTAAISKALYSDQDWPRAADLARDLMTSHPADQPAQRFALNSLGSAEVEQEHWVEALSAYERLISLFDSSANTETLEYALACHQKGYVLHEMRRSAEAETFLGHALQIREKLAGATATSTLTTRFNLGCTVLEQGRPKEAEEIFSDISTIREKELGPDNTDTLITRHMLAIAMLDQGRASDAVAIIRDILPRCEEVDGPDVTGTVVTRYCWADALVQAGDPEAAQAALLPIPESVSNRDWMPRHEAALSFVRGRVADALGNHVLADAYLQKTATILASIYKPDDLRRRKFDSYMAGRTPYQTGDA